MSKGFIGLSVLATLRDPSSAKVRGLVTNVVAGQLTLITWLSDGSQRNSLLVPGSNILDIEVEPDLIPPPTPTAGNGQKQPLLDPAILRYSKRERCGGQPSSDTHSDVLPLQEPETAPRAKLPPAQSLQSVTDMPKLGQDMTAADHRKASHPATSSKASDDVAASATLSAPFNDLSLNNSAQNVQYLDIDDSKTYLNGHLPEPNGIIPSPASRNARKRAKRGSIREGMLSTPSQTPLEPEGTSTSLTSQKRRSNNNKSGWRQTPLLEEPTQANIHVPLAHQPFTPPSSALTSKPFRQHSLKPELTRAERRRTKVEEEQNGWATGEATDIQDMGDFDFEENHKKFDKRKVFDQIRRDDTTADEARLVSFNRLPLRPGTAGGKNLHYTENVLDSPVQKIVEHSSGDSDVEISEPHIRSGRSLSRTSTRRNIPSRKGSALFNASLDRVGSPMLRSDSTISFRKSSLNQPKLSFVITSSKRTCPCITPVQMLELEQLATTELCLTEDMMTENAARSIAEAALGLWSWEDRRSTSTLVVILAGNNRTGSRAIAAGRHLRNHGTRVVLCILGLERGDEFLDSVRRQLKIFRSCGGQITRQDALVKTFRKLQSPMNLIIDALLGIHVSFDDLRTDDQATYFQLVCWANGSNVDIMSLDVPSGIDASTGKYSMTSDITPTSPTAEHLIGVSTFHDSTPLVVNAQHVVSLGAPKTGLLTSLFDMDEEMRPDLAVADIGISPVAWKKFGTRRRHGVDFGGAWLAPLEVLDGTQL